MTPPAFPADEIIPHNFDAVAPTRTAENAVDEVASSSLPFASITDLSALRGFVRGSRVFFLTPTDTWGHFTARIDPVDDTLVVSQTSFLDAVALFHSSPRAASPVSPDVPPLLTRELTIVSPDGSSFSHSLEPADSVIELPFSPPRPPSVDEAVEVLRTLPVQSILALFDVAGVPLLFSISNFPFSVVAHDLSLRIKRGEGRVKITRSDPSPFRCEGYFYTTSRIGEKLSIST